MQLRLLSEILVPAPMPDKTYEITLFEKHFFFHGLKRLLGAADFQKSGDVLAGLAAKSDLEREAAREILSSLTLQEIYDAPLVDDDGRVDNVTRVSYDIDYGVFTDKAQLTVGQVMICPQKVVQLNVSLRHDCLPSSKRPAKLVWVAQPGAAA